VTTSQSKDLHPSNSIVSIISLNSGGTVPNEAGPAIYNIELCGLLLLNTADGIEKVETEYSELFNLYYDYDFWLPGGLPGIGGRLEDISQRLKEIKEAD